MTKTDVVADPICDAAVLRVFQSYPAAVRHKLLILRQLILDTAHRTESIGPVTETLKWGEPSYLVVGGSTVRIAGIRNNPGQYAVYFNCKTLLVETFREIYRREFNFEANRAIVFDIADEIPVKALAHCLLLALSYHRLKQQPMLGV